MRAWASSGVIVWYDIGCSGDRRRFDCADSQDSAAGRREVSDGPATSGGGAPSRGEDEGVVDPDADVLAFGAGGAPAQGEHADHGAALQPDVVLDELAEERPADDATR